MRNRMCPSCGTGNVATARECKNCGGTLRPMQAPSMEDVQDSRCAWTEIGQRCTRGGVFSESTLGGGSWYCRRHDAIRRGLPDPGNPRQEASRILAGYGVPSGSTVDECRAYLRKILPEIGATKVERSRDWAHRILDRYVDGEPVPDVSLRFACEATGRTVEEVRSLKETA